jgi:hypothetical protein
MQADVHHLWLSIERQPDHWATVVINSLNGACLYRAQCTDVLAGQRVLLDFASCELGRLIADKDVTWTAPRSAAVHETGHRAHPAVPVPLLVE